MVICQAFFDMSGCCPACAFHEKALLVKRVHGDLGGVGFHLTEVGAHCRFQDDVGGNGVLPVKEPRVTTSPFSNSPSSLLSPDCWATMADVQIRMVDWDEFGQGGGGEQKQGKGLCLPNIQSFKKSHQ